MENWKRLGETKKDVNGVEYFCYYYDIDNAELTVAVESRSHKIMNVGCGTTMSKYVSIDGEHQYSERILNMSAVMAAAVGGYTSDDAFVMMPTLSISLFTIFDSGKSIILYLPPKGTLASVRCFVRSATLCSCRNLHGSSKCLRNKPSLVKPTLLIFRNMNRNRNYHIRRPHAYHPATSVRHLLRIYSCIFLLVIIFKSVY